MVREVQFFGDKQYKIWIKITELWISDKIQLLNECTENKLIRNFLFLTKTMISSESGDQKKSFTKF